KFLKRLKKYSSAARTRKTDIKKKGNRIHTPLLLSPVKSVCCVREKRQQQITGCSKQEKKTRR
uniref:Uncharacterized protein n=1 Tax=Anopheles atroparvus TaxID=41427 RepID=A0AAG5CU45_ANOAO